MTQRKYKLATLGCRTNQYESQAFAAQLQELGFVEAQQDEEADLCIVNTCTVTASADSHSRHAIRQLAQHNPNAKIAVTGCLAERAAEQLLAIQGVSHVIPNEKKEQLLSMVFPQETPLPEFRINTFEGHTRAFVKVQDGCNSFCSYCIIPYVRGRSRSRPLPDILSEIQSLIASGYKEVVLTGINIGDFRGENGESLADLVKAVDVLPGLHRLRISSIDPDEVDEALASAVLNGRNTCPSMHIVLQSGSNMILKRMNRKYTKQMFLTTTERLRAANPDFTFTTDVIVGFPGETDADFQDTLDMIEQVGFAKVHMFPYSERQRTKAALFPNKIPPPLIQKRKQQVLGVAQTVAFRLRDAYVGRRLSILIEANKMGHTANFLPVMVQSDTVHPHEIITVRCIANTPEALIGEICK